MKKKTKKKTKRRAHKNPSDFSLLAREVVEAAIGEPLTKRKKRRSQ